MLLCVLWLSVLPLLSAAAVEAALGPIDLSGHIGYNMRQLSYASGSETSSQQLVGTANVATYIGEPWLALTNLSVTVTQDSSEFEELAGSGSHSSQILTGEYGLNLLPQSRTPFNLQLQLMDSRVDQEAVGGTPITFLGQDYSSISLGLRQSWLTESGGRYLARLSTRSWESTASGKYDNVLIGGEVDLKGTQEHLMVRGTVETTERDLDNSKNQNFIADISHFYYPLRYLRLDSRATVYDLERSFLDPADNGDNRISTTDILQLSSTAFWRPEERPLSISGGLRFYQAEGAEGGVTGSELTQMTLNGGAFYRPSKNLRLDGSVTSTFQDTNDVQDDRHNMRMGGLYQSDWYRPWGYDYQWYSDASLTSDSSLAQESKILALNAGHGLGHTLYFGERHSNTSLRLNAAQQLGLSAGSGGDETLSEGVRLSNNLSAAFNQDIWSGQTLAQLTLSHMQYAYKARGESFTDSTQMINLQLSRTQEISRRSFFTGSLTTQYVRQAFAAANSSVTTSTAKIRYEHQRLWGVPRLRYHSDFMISNTDADGTTDRQDWENGLFYGIGLLDTSFSYRLTQSDGQDYDLLYFRVTRRF